jgi:hypothetical protein
MPITKYDGRTLTKQVIVLEETWLVNCVLRECVIFYSGGSFQIEGGTFQNCQWKFAGPAQMTITVLSMIGLLPKPQIPVQMTPPSGPVN